MKTSLFLILYLAYQVFSVGLLTQCTTKWKPDAILPSIVNGYERNITYTFYFMVESVGATTAKVQFPPEFGLRTELTLTMDSSSLDGLGQLIPNTCLQGNVTGINNPESLTSTGPFMLWTLSNGQQMLDANYHFDTLGFASSINEFTYSTAQITSGSSSKIQELTKIEVTLKLSKSIRKQDFLSITFDSNFIVRGISSVQSFRNSTFSTWKSNQAIGTNQVNSKQQYFLDYTISGQELIIYNFELDPRLSTNTDESYSWLGLWIDGVRNPSYEFSPGKLVLSIESRKFSYDTHLRELLERTKTVTLGNKINKGTIQKYGCGTTNTYSSYYQLFPKKSTLYQSSSKIDPIMLPLGLNVLMDYTFTTEHPVEKDGEIEVIIKNQKSQESWPGSYQDCFVEGLTPIGDSYVGCTWRDDSTIVISNFSTSTTPVSVLLRVQNQIVTSGCFKGISIKAANQKTIDSITDFSTAVLEKTIEIYPDTNKDIYYTVFGWNLVQPFWSFSFSQSNMGATAQLFHFECTNNVNCGQFPTAYTDGFSNWDYTFNLWSVASTPYYYYSGDDELLCSDQNPLIQSSYNSADCDEVNGKIQAQIDYKNNYNFNLSSWWVGKLSDIKNPQMSSIKQALPKYPSVPATISNYEICFSQSILPKSMSGITADLLPRRIACGVFDVTVTTDLADGGNACGESCFVFMQGGNQYQGTWDFYVATFNLPEAPEPSGMIDEGNLVQSPVIPANTEANPVVLKIECVDPQTLLNEDLGIKDQSHLRNWNYPISISTKRQEEKPNGYSKKPRFKVDKWTYTIE